MRTAERNLIVTELLLKVYGGAYSSIELNKALNALRDERDKAYVSRLFYGVLSKNVQLDYILSVLAPKKPKPKVALVIKTGIYMLRYMDEPDYAVIDTQTELVKKLGKKELAGFVNAVLRKSKDVKIPITTKDKAFETSVNFSCPLWITAKLIAQYGLDFTRAFLGAILTDKTHVRINTDKISEEDFKAKLSYFNETPCGLFADYAELKKIDSSLYTFQSLASGLAVKYYAAGLETGAKVLDLCAAPGGKSVYMAQLMKAEVTACDLYPHRVELIRSYARRMGVNLTAMQNDATKYRPEFFEKFDCVICDVPCSGLGVMFSKPDVTFNRSEKDITALNDIQYAILSQAAKYVKKGGFLNYSTCTVLREENEDIVKRFLSGQSGFSLVCAEADGVKADEDDFVRLFPHTHGCDGFFVAKLRRDF